MNINGHKVKRHLSDGKIYIDYNASDYSGDMEPEFYMRLAEESRIEANRQIQEAEQAELIAEFVHREREKKPADDAARELDTRAAIVASVLMPPVEYDNLSRASQDMCREIIRRLDAAKLKIEKVPYSKGGVV